MPDGWSIDGVTSARDEHRGGCVDEAAVGGEAVYVFTAPATAWISRADFFDLFYVVVCLVTAFPGSVNTELENLTFLPLWGTACYILQKICYVIYTMCYMRYTILYTIYYIPYTIYYRLNHSPQGTL